MLLENGFAALAACAIAGTRISALSGSDCERLASHFDGSQAAFPARLGNARVAMPARLSNLLAGYLSEVSRMKKFLSVVGALVAAMDLVHS
jgi:hypothetical protein